MKESGPDIRTLFARLFFDLGFLEQKLRITGLPNILGDFARYRDDITGGDIHKIILLDQLSAFLPTIEEFIIRSEDTCLLQFALAINDLGMEALEQARAFKNRVWFRDM